MNPEAASYIKLAREIVAGAIARPTEVYELAGKLMDDGDFGLARAILARVRASNVDAELRAKLGRLHAQATCRDVELPVDSRIAEALQILQESDPPQASANPDTLSGTGDILRYRWSIFGHREDLESAYSYYLGAWDARGPYSVCSAVAAAAVLDLLSEQVHEKDAVELQNSARKLRQDVLNEFAGATPVPGREWEHFVSLGETAFGLKNYDQAKEWLRRAALVPNVAGWRRESKARDLATLLRHHVARTATLQELKASPGAGALEEFVRGCGGDLDSVLIGRVGLVLWGGGLRAALFHVGVLAKLADNDMLRRVELVSCASGGSITGALFYLEARRLLETTPEEKIGRQDYIDLVERVQHKLLRAIQRDLRNRALSNPFSHLRSIVDPSWSRSERLAGLFEDEIFHEADERLSGRPLYLNDLTTQPFGVKEPFRPDRDNWKRRTKVPILTLNATTLNTGGNWQFTTTWMGEPQQVSHTEVGGGDRLRRVYYADAPERYRRMRLGRAVSASACLAGLFEPMAFPDLYSKQYTVRLIDGSLYSKPGLVGMLEGGCTIMLVSDASSQIAPEANPDSGVLSLISRLQAIVLARLRQSELQNLLLWRFSPTVRQLVLVHSRKGLDAHVVEPIERAPSSADDAQEFGEGPLTPYGIRKDIQEKIAFIRTDLDAFSDLEAYALMTSAYRITDYELSKQDVIGSAEPLSRHRWEFLVVEEAMTRKQESGEGVDQLKRALDVGRHSGLRILRLSSSTRWSLAAFLLLLAAIFTPVGFPILIRIPVLFFHIRTIELFRMAFWVAAVLVFLRVVNRKPFSENLFSLMMGVFGWLPALANLLIFDRLYLAWGRVERPAQGNAFTRFTQLQPAAGITNLIDRSEAVDSVRRLLEFDGYQVEYFPRERATFQSNVDLLAKSKDKSLVVMIRTNADSPQPVDWTIATGLQTAIWSFADESRFPIESLKALMVLADVGKDATLEQFCQMTSIALLEVTLSQLQGARDKGNPRTEALLRELNEKLGSVPRNGGGTPQSVPASD